MAAIFVCSPIKRTECMSGPRAMALSTQRPVTTMSAPWSRQRRIGRALTERGRVRHTAVWLHGVCQSVFVPHVGIHTVERRRQLTGAAIIRNLYFSQALPLRREQ